MWLQGCKPWLIGSMLVIGLAGCGGGSGGGGDDGLPQLDAESPADLSDPAEVARRFLLLRGEVGTASDEFAELTGLLQEAIDAAPGDGTFACTGGGQLELLTGEIADRPNPFGADDGFELAIITAFDCQVDGNTLDGVIEGGDRTDTVEPAVSYVGAGLSESDSLELDESGANIRAFARLFRKEDGGIERISGKSLSSGEFPGQDAAEQLDLLGSGGTGFFELTFDRSASPNTISGQGRVRVDRLTEGGNRCSAPGTFDFRVIREIELDSGGTPIAGEIEFSIDGDTAVVEVAGGGIVVTVGTEDTGFDPASLAMFQAGVDFCTDGA